MEVGDLVKRRLSPWVFRRPDIGIIYSKTEDSVHVNWFEWGIVRYNIESTLYELEIISL